MKSYNQLNELRDEIFDYAKKQGFHEKPFNFGEALMLVVSELSEALEADRNEKYAENPLVPIPNKEVGYNNLLYIEPENITKVFYEQYVKGTVEEEIADAIIRLCHLAKHKDVNLDWHIRAKMAYNEMRPYKHGKKY